MAETNLKYLFDPKNIAVIGVSDISTKLATVIYKNILTAGYKGDVFPVNPKYKEVFDVKCYKKIGDIKGSVDLAVIVIPAEFVPQVVKECADSGVKFTIVISAGFGEINEEGEQIEKEMSEYAKKNGMRILGPNCLGISVPNAKLNATFAAQKVKEGNIAFLSQSGAFNTALLDIAEEQDLGFSHFVSMGNKSDLNEMDFLDYWISDPKVKVIGMYLEEFSDGKDFLDKLKGKTHKPIVLLHPGETGAAQKAITSHTGSMAGSPVIVRTALKQNGIIQVKSLEKMVAVLKAISFSKLPKGNRVAIITNAGGPGIILTDEIVSQGLELAELEEKTQSELKKALPKASSSHNPIDVVGDALADRYKTALDIAGKDQNIDSIVVLMSPQIVTQVEETAKVIIDFALNSEKTIIPIFIGGMYVQPGLDRLQSQGVASYGSIENAVYALRKLYDHSVFVESEKVKAVIEKSNIGKYTSEVEKATTDKPEPLDEALSEKLAQEVSLYLPKQKIIRTFTEALEFAKSSGFPVVMKATTKDITHKTDLRALFTNIFSEDELRKAFEEIQAVVLKSSRNTNPDILIQEHIKANEEIIIGANRDGDSKVYENGRGFGHLLLVGKGGIYTELYRDTGTGLVPLTKEQIKKFIDETKISKVIKGFRGKPPLAYDKVVDTIEAIQKMVLAYPQIVSLDINPAMLTEEKCIVVDIKIFVGK